MPKPDHALALGANLAVDEVETVVVMNEVSARHRDENSLAEWISRRAVPFDLDAD